MSDSIKEIISDIFDLWSEVSSINPQEVYKAVNTQNKLRDVLKEVSELLPYIDSVHVPDYALLLLESLGLKPDSEYGYELATAAVYFNKALFYNAKGDADSALSCLQVVAEIPEWRVIYGKKTLLDIKEEAKKLKTEINK